MKLYTVEELPGVEFEVLEMVYGSTVQSKNIGRDIGAGLKSMVGGELKGYTEMLRDARTVATNRMIVEAKRLGATAVIGVRFSSSTIIQGAAEIIVYGTAIREIE